MVTSQDSNETESGIQSPRNWRIFLCAVFFVFGFSLVFSLVGVLLQSVLVSISYTLSVWLGRIAGVIIILFGLHMVGLLEFSFLQREYKFHVSKKFSSDYLTSFVFGAAFAIGWTPCVGPVLGAILSLAITQPPQAFFLMLAYSLGLGIPFLLVGFFTQQARAWITKAGKWLEFVKIFFGVILTIMGVLVFTGHLAKIASLSFAADFLLSLGFETLISGEHLSLAVAFIAGLVSFLSPCILPLIPAFLSYLASVVVNKK